MPTTVKLPVNCKAKSQLHVVYRARLSMGETQAPSVGTQAPVDEYWYVDASPKR